MKIVNFVASTIEYSALIIAGDTWAQVCASWDDAVRLVIASRLSNGAERFEPMVKS